MEFVCDEKLDFLDKPDKPMLILIRDVIAYTGNFHKIE